MANQHTPALQEELSALDPNLTEDDLLQDPALAMCCMEEVQNQRKATALRQKLLAQDRSSQRQKLMAQTLQPPHARETHSNAVPAQHQQACHPGCFVTPDSVTPHADGGQEDELSALRMRRLREMQREAAAKQQRAEAGYGQLHTLAQEQHLLSEVEAQEGPCVCHLAVSGYQPCDECDQLLETLAHQWRNTWFVRCCTSRKSTLRAQLNVDTLPAVVCFKAGALIGKAPLHMFGAAVGDIIEEELIRYLKRLGVLQKPAPASASNNAQQSSAQDSDVSDDEQEAGQRLNELQGSQPPCDLCGRTYPHQHVKAVYGQDPDSEDSDDL